jgi:hypothetical protein
MEQIALEGQALAHPTLHKKQPDDMRTAERHAATEKVRFKTDYGNKRSSNMSLLHRFGEKAPMFSGLSGWFGRGGRCRAERGWTRGWHREHKVNISSPARPHPMTDPVTISDDFDFEFGAWRVCHRRLKERLSGCDDWETFEGTSETRPVLGGNGNIENNLLQFPGGPYRAIAIRAFDPAKGTWAIWWLSAGDPHHLDVPVIGGFKHGTGSFFAQDHMRGDPVTVRFLWLRKHTAAPRWEQAMSRDGGTTWETNWTMDFERAG